MYIKNCKIIYLFISSKHNIYAHFSIFSRYCQTLAMGKYFGRVYKHSQPNCSHPYTNTAFVVTTQSLLTSQHYSTTYCGITVIGQKQPSPVSKITTTNQVDNGINNDDDT